MNVRVVGGNKPVFESVGCVTKEPVYGTLESVRYAKEQFMERQGHPLSALELKHSVGSEIGEIGVYPASCINLILDGRDKEILVIDGMAKGYIGEGPRGALTLDAYYLLLNIPLKREVLSREMIERFKSEKIIDAPEPKRPEFNLKNLGQVKNLARWAHLELVEPAGFDKLSEGMSLEEMLEAVDFHRYGSWG